MANRDGIELAGDGVYATCKVAQKKIISVNNVFLCAKKRTIFVKKRILCVITNSLCPTESDNSD